MTDIFSTQVMHSSPHQCGSQKDGWKKIRNKRPLFNIFYKKLIQVLNDSLKKYEIWYGTRKMANHLFLILCKFYTKSFKFFDIVEKKYKRKDHLSTFYIKPFLFP